MIHAYRGVVPKGILLMGAPARVKRSVTDKGYIGLAAEYKIAQGT